MSEAKEHTPAYHRRKAQRPAEILQAALEEFHTYGYTAARLDRIARRAGVSRGTVYIYYDNKDALFDAVAEQAMGTFVDEVAQTAISFAGTTEDLLRQVLRRFYDMVTTTKNSALLRILISEGPSRPELVQRYHAQVIRRGHAALEQVIARGIKRGEVRDGPAARFPQMLIAPAMFYVIHTMVFGDLEKLDVDAYLEGHIDMLTNGLGLSPA